MGTEDDIQRMLACQVHLGTKNCDFQMEKYTYKRRAQDGVYIFDLSKTWEKMMLAARIIVAIENPQDVCVIAARPFGGRAVLKYAQHTGAQYIAGRYTPGTFTNYIQRKYMEPSRPPRRPSCLHSKLCSTHQQPLRPLLTL